MDYAQIDATLKASLREDASFLHGFWHGLNAGNDSWDLKAWLDALVAEFAISSMPAQLLKAFQDIHVTSSEQLAEDPLSISLLLPSDDDSLSLRAYALQQWCQGYLYGLGLGNRITNWKTLPNEFREWIEDITHISQLDETAIQDTNEEESDFFDLSEYVRLAVGHIAEHLTPTTKPTLH
ncbi:MAG: UPF0149 family protein [Thiotrichales bacterium]|jgi:hypothetical protein|nr:UPF0149 family protein [Thiotrichales bacterium]